MESGVRALLLGLTLACAVGCRLVDASPKGRSPLIPLVASPDAVTLEVFSAPAQLDDNQLASLWSQVDEQPLAPELRQRLALGGMRAGIVGPGVPDALAALLKVTDERVSSDERSLVPMEMEQGVTLRVMQVNAGSRYELPMSQTHEEMPLLESVHGQVEGRTYQKADGLLAMHVFCEPAGRVRIELAPEIHYGEFKNRVRGADAMLVMKQERKKKLFEDLNTTATLGPGQMLVITALPDTPGTVGHYFFTDTSGDKPVQKLYVIRVSQAGPDRSFAEAPKEATREPANDQAE